MENKYVLLANRWWLAVMCLVSVAMSAQGQSAQSPTIQWQRVIEPIRGPIDSPPRVISADDGGFAVATGSELIRLSPSGDVNWRANIREVIGLNAPDQSSYRANVVDVESAPDDGFVVLVTTGFTDESGGFTIAKVNSQGVRVWSTTAESNRYRNEIFSGVSVLPTADGGYLAVGTHDKALFYQFVTLTKFDSNGNRLWGKELTFPYPVVNGDASGYTKARRAVLLDDGSVLLVGQTRRQTENTTRGWAAKVDGSGNAIWQKRYEGRAYLDDVDESAIAETGYVAIGATTQNSTATLNITMDGEAGGGFMGENRPVGTTSAIATIPATNGQPAYYALLDVATANTGDFRLMNVTSSTQTPVWTKLLGGSGVDAATDMVATADGYLLVGTTTSTDGDVQGKGGNSIATWVVKLKNAVSANALTLTQPTYNCQTGAITFNISGGDNSPITYSAPGISRTSATSNTGTVEQGLRNDPKPITLTAMQSGQSVSYTFDLKGYCTTSSKHPDIDPLTDLYNATNGPGWTNSTNWLQGNSPCNWWGVTCNSSGRVEKLQLDGNKLVGTLPASLGNLTYLSSLYLVNNQLSGSIPASVGNLTALANLFLHTNQLSGPIPASLGNLSELLNLSLSFNQLSGPIPASLNNLSKLTFIELGNNQLTGSIPENWGNFPALVGILLSNNQLTGSIPASFGNKPALQMLYLYNNQLSGCFPSALSALCSKDARLSGNAGLPGGGDFASFCANKIGACSTTPPTPTGGTLAMSQPMYNCQTGAITFNTSGGDGSPITYNAPGISRTSLTSNSGTVEPGLRNDPKPITIMAMQGGTTVSYTFDFGAYCTNPTPPVTPPTPPVNPPSGNALTLLAPTYDCATGAITFRTSGGDGSVIEYAAAGISGWSANPNQFVDRDSRTAGDVKPFTLMARQNGVVVSYTWDLKAACGRARLGVGEGVSGLRVSVLGNPVSEAVRVEVRGIEGQPLLLRLVDLTGHVLESRMVEQAVEVERHRFELPQGSAPGLLLLRASSGSQSQTVKILKQ